MKKILTLLFAIVASIGVAHAELITVDGITYEITYKFSTGGYTATVYSGNNCSGHVIIPSTINYTYQHYDSSTGTYIPITETYTVTSIGNSAFADCSSLVSVTIPNSITNIGDYAFYNCSSLVSVTIGVNVTMIGEQAFSGCNSVTHVIWNAKNCSWWFGSQVESFVFGDEVEIIPASICSGMNKLTSITIPNSVKSIGQYAFSKCTGLTSVTIPNSVTSIGEGAFKFCSSLTSVTIPNSVTNIGKETFFNCSSLTSVTIGSNVTNIGVYAFRNCIALTTIEIPNSVITLESGAFYDCNGLTSVTIGNNVKSIGDSAFRGCSSLTSVIIPNSVTSIGNYAFYGCSGLTSVTIGNNVKSIGGWAFGECIGLTGELVIPNSVTSIGGAAFYMCRGLTSVTIGNNVKSIGDSAFRGCTNLRGELVIPNSVTSIEQNAFYWCDSLTSVTIPNSVTNIGYRAFCCESLTFVEINSDKITGQYRDIFGPQVTEYVLGDSIKSIGDSAFYWSSSLTSITIPTSVTSIGDYAFHYCCMNLTSVEIPNGVTSIGNNAFSSCSRLDSLVFKSETPATLGKDAFYYTKNCPLIVPCSAVDAYKTAWPEYANRITCSGTQGTTVTIPTVQDLATAGYDVINKVVLCLRFTDDATVCNDIYAVGTFNNWAKGEGNIEDFANCSKFEPLAGFEGWYAVEFPYSDNVQGKPVQAKSNGAFSWEYQSGDENAWTNKGGSGSQTATIWAGYNNEANIYYPAPGCYIYELAYWKNHNSPCANTTHNYTLHMYAPDACEEMKPAIIGNFNNWNTGVAMKDTTDAQGKKMFTITIASDEGLVFKFRDASYDDWSNELQEFLEGYNVWATFSNFMIPAVTQDTTIVYDFSDNDKYRFAQCEKEENVIVWLRVPTGAPGYYNGAIEMVVYSADESTTMPMLYSPVDNLWAVVLQAKGSDYFSVREANSEDNYILDYVHYYYSDGSDEYVWETWGTTFQHYWENGTGDFAGYKTAMIDLTNPASFKWAVPAIETDIENVQRDDVPCTMVSKFLWDGQIYILNNGIMYNVQGQKVK